MKYFLTCIFVFFLIISVSAQPEDSRIRLEALDNINQGKYGEAIELLNRYISANPQLPEGFNLRGICFEKRGEYEKSVYDFRSALKLDPVNKVYQSNLARTTEEFNKLLYNIIAGYKREIAINSAEPKNYLEVGKGYKKLGEWLEAEKWYDEYILREEPSSDEVIRYSEILVKTGHISKGEPILKKFTEKYPIDHRLWSRYGYFTMWLGKKRIALAAFETALGLRPYFKEAMDGYDLVRGKGYVYTVNDTTSRYNYGIPIQKKSKSYAIDRFYRKLKRYPEDIDTRYLLIAELVKKNRFEEARLQIEKLSRLDSDKNRILLTKENVELKRNKYYDNSIAALKKKLQQNPSDKKSLFKLINYYSYRSEFYKAIDLVDDFLNKNKPDDKILYQKAKLYSQIGELESARDEMEKVVSAYPVKMDYRLLYGQLLVWLNSDLDEAEKNLKTVLSAEPRNIDAITALLMLHLQKNELNDAKYYLERGLKLDPANNELLKMENSIALQERNNEKAFAYNLLETAREHAFKKNCDEAIRIYKKYFAHAYSDDHLRKELAEAYLCKNDYNEAIIIYEDLVNDYPHDFEIAKQLAKVYFWSGDSISALQNLEKLSATNKKDAEVQLFLGDTYLKFRDYENAELIYRELLDISPSSHILQTRMSWLGEEGIYGYSPSFPAYFSIIPSASFFSDNLDFSYNLQGAKLELGLSRFLALSFGGYIGSLRSEDKRLNLNILRADGVLKINKFIKAAAGAGITNFDDDESSNIFEAAITAEKENKYSFFIGFYASDAAQLLYSPPLVEKRLNANYTKLAGEFTTNDKILLGAEFMYITVSDNNRGNKLVLKIGKGFDDSFKSGYEYLHYNFNEQKSEYWSPENFETHSAWINWNAVSEKELNLNLKGKVGLVPVDNFIVKEIEGVLYYNFTRNLVLQTSVTFGNTVRSDEGYNSLSFSISLFWTL